MSNNTCWLCVHCDLEEVVEMMTFVEEKSPIMHVDMISSQVCEALRDSFPDEKDHFTESLVKNHICRHVVTPVASVTRITRDLLDMCESLKPTLEGMRMPKRRRAIRAIDTSLVSTDEMDVVKTTDECLTSNENDSETSPYCPENMVLYLRTVGQVMGIYRMHHKLLTAAPLARGGGE